MTIPDQIRPTVDELTLLYEVSQRLDAAPEMERIADPILELISDRMGFEYASLTLLNRKTGKIRIEAAAGLSVKERERGQYRLGEGVTGSVVESGDPVLIPDIAADPRFLDRTGRKKHGAPHKQAFLCIPIKLGKEVVGTIGGCMNHPGDGELHNCQRILTVIGSMIAQAVKLRQAWREEQERLQAENKRLQEELQERYRPTNIIGNSQPMHAVYEQIKQVAGSDANVLIRGESGTGKELVAHAIHHKSPRAGRPYVKVNCAALPETILESELFGHERGAFTGATGMRKGRFELADGGTIFLDEVGDFSPATQVKLLRVLQEREFERVGGTSTIRVNVRILAATNRNLEEMVSAGTFREDLYYRLNVFPIHLPPLRSRKSDILLLADHFVQKYAKSMDKPVRRISTMAIDMMMAYHWPGNVRELENCIERAVLVSEDQVIHGHHLPPSLQTSEESGTPPRGNLEETLAAIEREMLVDALKSTQGNCVRAAAQLGVSERIMGLRLKKYRINYKQFRTRAGL